MIILFLGSADNKLVDFLKQSGNEVHVFEEKITPETLKTLQTEWIISYGYRHIISKEIIDLIYPRIINLHISYLPWNRGADPNLWSFIDETPKGVTIHLVDEGLDTGDILIQKEVEFKDLETETLSSTYQILKKEIETLFMANWEKISTLKIEARPQLGKGSYHKSSQKNEILQLLTYGYQTKVVELNKLIKTN